MGASLLNRLRSRSRRKSPTPSDRDVWAADAAQEEVGCEHASPLPQADLAQLRRQLITSLTEDDWAEARAGFGDPELATG